MTLNSPWFELTKSGKKIYEGRKKAAKYTDMQKGDIITFYHHTDKTIEPFHVIVKNIYTFPTFKDALEILPIEDVLPIDGVTVQKGVEIYYNYVSQKTQEKEGIIMIKTSLL